jgi:hypothetical protein
MKVVYYPQFNELWFIAGFQIIFKHPYKPTEKL